MGYRAVLFDIGDTLWHSAGAPPAAEFRRIAAQRATAFLAAEGLPSASGEHVARVAWDALETAMRAARQGNLLEPDYAEVALAALRGIGLDVSKDHATRLMEAIYVSGEDGGKVAYGDARETLERLRDRGFRIGIVTNRAFGGVRFREDLAAAGLDVPWDVITVSVEVGFLKPHPRIFERALSELRLPPDSAVMVGNSLAEDVRGAQAVGMRAAWKRSAPDAEGVTPDFTFDSTKELLDWEVLRSADS